MHGGELSGPRGAVEDGIRSVRRALVMLREEIGVEPVSEKLSKSISYLELLLPELPGEATRVSESGLEYEPRLLRIEPLLAPLPGGDPGGENIRASGVLRELQSLTVNRSRSASFEPQWAESARLAREILSTRSKDLAVAACLVAGLTFTNGFEGLLDGTVALRRLLEERWDDLYPRVEDGDVIPRAEELAKLQELVVARLYDALGQPHEYSPPPSEAEPGGRVLDVLSATLQDFRRWLRDRFGDEAPNLGHLADTVEAYRSRMAECGRHLDQRHAAEASQQVELARAAVESTVDQAMETSREAERLASLPSIPVAPQDVQDARARLLRCAEFLREQAPADPSSFVIARLLRWYAPQDDGPSLPSQDDRVRVLAHRRAEEWPDLLRACEETFLAGGHLWLDLQRYAVEAATRIDHPLVAEAVLMLLRERLRQDEELLTRCLDDGMPAATEETREWLGGLLVTLAAGEEAASHDGASPRLTDVDFEPVVFEAAGLAARSRIDRGMQLFLDRERASSSGRERFLWRLHLAEYCIENSREGVVLPTLDDMARKVDSLRLEEWESKELLCRVLRAGLRAHARAGEGAGSSERVHELRNRLMRIDPMQGLSFSPASGNGVSDG